MTETMYTEFIQYCKKRYILIGFILLGVGFIFILKGLKRRVDVVKDNLREAPRRYRSAEETS